MYLLHPTGLPKLSFGSNCNPRQHLINTKKSTFIFLLSSLPPIQRCRVAKNSVPRCLSCLYIKIKWRERGGLQKRYIRFSHDCGFKKQKHLFTIIQECGFYNWAMPFRNTWKGKTCIQLTIYLFKVNNGNTWKRCEKCSKLTIKTPEHIVNFKHDWEKVIIS